MSTRGSAVLSAEQLKRIEENRHKAKEKLASRKQQQTVAHKKPIFSAQKSSQRQVSVSTAHSRFPSAICSGEIGRSTNRNVHPKALEFHTSSTSVTAANKSSRAQQPPAMSSNTVKYTQIVKKDLKANLTLVSKQRFEIVVPYDKLAIEVFKKTPSNAYNAKTATWSFGIEAYNKLVTALQKECQHIELNQIPKPVVSLFQSLSPANAGISHSTSDSEVSWSRVGTKLSSTLMQFQREGVDYCIRCGGRALLADDMGLGKTLQALAVMSHYRSNWPLLVICPSSVKLTWAEACYRWVSALKEDDVSVVLTGKLPGTSSPITIISFDLATRLGTELAQRRPDAIIVDESHFLKNFKTNRCKAILPLVKSATRCLLLSGTPALSRPIELYTQISALDKSFRITSINFGIRYCSGVKNHFGWDFSGASNLNELHLYMQEKFMIRRLKINVLDQLPSKRRQTVLLDPSMTKTHSREVRELRKELEEAGTLKGMDRRSALLPLFEKTGRLKLPAVRDYILDLLEGGRKLIVFGHHKSVLDSISECLHTKNYEYVRIDGRTPVETRQQLCDKFQHDDSCLVAVLSITTANAGLTLTASSTVVFAELFWNPGILVQAEDRVYRIGQKNSVNIHYLVARETADDFIWPLIRNKLVVLNKAGLAVDDFSTTDSTVLKSSESQQQDLFDIFNEAPADLDTGESNMTIEDNSREGSDTEEAKKKSKKRKRIMVEPLTESDPDFSSRTQRQKNPHKKVCSVLSPPKKESNSKQRTLTSMCTESTSERRSGGSRGRDFTKQSKATDLAAYLLSQHSMESSSCTTISTSTMIKATSTRTGAYHQRDNDASVPVERDVDVQPLGASSKAADLETCDDGGPSVSGCEEKWFDDLRDCDLVSFDNFDDDAGT